MFAWPAALFVVPVFVLGPLFLTPDGLLPTWLVNLVWLLGNGAELAAALIILRGEGYRLTPTALRDRIKWRFPDRWWKWVASFGVVVLALVLANLTGPLSAKLASIPGFSMPDWHPDHPLREINSVQDAYPDVNLAGNYLFFLFRFGILGVVCNFIGEELYYRGTLMPKMRGVFGKWTWVANGILFALKHAYKIWLLPSFWTAGLLAFIFGPLGSLPLALFWHWVANDLLVIIATIPVVFGGG